MSDELTSAIADIKHRLHTQKPALAIRQSGTGAVNREHVEQHAELDALWEVVEKLAQALDGRA